MRFSTHSNELDLLESSDVDEQPLDALQIQTSYLMPHSPDVIVSQLVTTIDVLLSLCAAIIVGAFGAIKRIREKCFMRNHRAFLAE